MTTLSPKTLQAIPPVSQEADIKEPINQIEALALSSDEALDLREKIRTAFYEIAEKMKEELILSNS